MSGRVRQAASVAVIPTGVLLLVLVALPGRVGLAVHVWLLVVLAIGLVALLLGMREDVPLRASSFDTVLVQSPPAPARPPSLARVEREVSMGAETAFDTHYRLRPLFRDLAGGLLLSHHGIDLDRSPDRARALVGDELWALVRPGVVPPEDRGGAGMPHASIAAAVADLERLAWS